MVDADTIHVMHLMRTKAEGDWSSTGLPSLAASFSWELALAS